jgi:ribonuclease T2
LSLSWSPAYCLQSPESPQCTGSRRYGFVVHGLWPQNEGDWPQFCDVHVPVPDAVVAGIIDLMPARGLIYHEWSAHGTCSGLDPAAFFALVRRAYDSVVIPSSLTREGAAVSQPTSAIVNAFLQANPRLTSDALLITCSGQDTPRLREVRLCLNRDLSPRACSPAALRGACPAPVLIVPPIR